MSGGALKLCPLTLLILAIIVQRRTSFFLLRCLCVSGSVHRGRSLGPPRDDAERIPSQDPVRHSAADLAQAGRGGRVQEAPGIPLSSVQDECAAGHSEYNRSFDQLRAHVAHSVQEAGESLD